MAFKIGSYCLYCLILPIISVEALSVPTGDAGCDFGFLLGRGRGHSAEMKCCDLDRDDGSGAVKGGEGLGLSSDCKRLRLQAAPSDHTGAPGATVLDQVLCPSTLSDGAEDRRTDLTASRPRPLSQRAPLEGRGRGRHFVLQICLVYRLCSLSRRARATACPHCEAKGCWLLHARWPNTGVAGSSECVASFNVCGWNQCSRLQIAWYWNSPYHRPTIRRPPICPRSAFSR